ncbi:LysR family transcriptional regulator [Marinagarivorans cellulosilyticus]|uniref:HTH lysR-type domain-containing protein n=1 Tax=Marinagarivorans cellulosilyticus TaxID=2721545 RepID=A0AAN1WF70_9GAMM|nr:LysR family transcriptional regulator [Marinagarivorans cellulosilyticus]BCD96489.1 hypothetical protein MARGE09_P0689 [Marinagarivorans cellulosilyticus]
MDTLEGMRVFIAVARKQSFTGGAKVLGISTKLASKYVAQLEAKLSAQLFNRTTRSVSLTATGASYLERCSAIVDQLDELEDLVQQRQAELAGPIRITAPTGFGSHQLIQALNPFQLANPKVEIDLHLSDQRVAIVEEGFDLAVRFGALEDSTLIARKLMNMRVVTFASPAYLAQHGTPRTPEELSEHNCVISKAATHPYHWKFNNTGKTLTVVVSGSHQANAPRAVAHMVAGGIGISRGPLYSVAPFLKSGQLQLVLEDYEREGFSLYAVYPTSRHLTARIRALIDHLVDYFSQ